MLTINTIPPPVLAAQQKIKKYQKPTFEVIDLDMESPLLSGSGKPTTKKLPTVNPIDNGTDW